ncbi:RidA family protein [Ramlibacter sp. AW1]|uniref:RidA family protein n=2 Tax=Ramlibacter aurantiacus TaxID=2801330 RepID=A0A936ZN07_9BURK|nr:RidA family protein [Ramlibacter aurantiacus]
MISEHPYSFVHEREGIVYVSGATTIDYDTHQPVPGRRPALDAALNEVERRLGTVGLGLADVAKVTYYLVDISLRSEANEQFQDRFPPTKPARSVVGVSAAPYGGCAVIDVIAHRKPANQ